MDQKTVFENLVRVGTVTDVNNAKRLARVKLQDSGIPSDWLYVLAARPYIPDYGGLQRTEFEVGGSGDPAFASHKHDLVIRPWMPRIGATVLCLYVPIFDGDGFILGEIGALGDILQN